MDISQSDLRADDSDRGPNGRAGDPERRYTILLTGGTGVLGAALLERLSRHRVICLVHTASPDRDDVEIVRGNLTERFLGLDESKYADLAQAVDCVVHAAATTNFTMPVADICSANVEGTRRVAELARAAEARLVHVSTAFVHTDTRFVDCTAAKEDLDDPCEAPPPDRGAQMYVNSKREGDGLVAELPLPCIVVRPSIVLGHSETGEISDFQGLHVLAGLAVKGKLPMLPSNPTARVDFLPLDTVADAVGALIESGRTDGEYWLTAGESAPTVEQILAAAERFARQIGLDPQTPRFVEPDVVDRLIRPVFLDKLPDKVSSRLELLFALMPMVDSAEPFPSSLGELQDELDIAPPPDPLDVFDNNLEYWAKAQQLMEAPA